MMLLFPISFPLVCAVIAIALSKFMPKTSKFLGFAGTSLLLIAVFTLYNLSTEGYIQIVNEPDVFSYTIALFIAFFSFLASLSGIREEKKPGFYINLLISAAFAVGAVLADNFLMMLFFWEGLLVTLYAFLLPYNCKTAAKAFLINAVGDIVLLVGICLFYIQARTLIFTEANLSNLNCQGVWAFILIFTGTVAKAGAFPFHSWIAPASKDASYSFMAMLPASIEKLLAVFLMGKIFMVLFPILPASARVYAACLGIITIVAAALRMLNFKDLKELAAWNIIMQIGLLIMSVSVRDMSPTPVNADYLLNHGIFKAALLACLFFTTATFSYLCNGISMENIKGAGKKYKFLFFMLIICALGLGSVSLVDFIFIPNILLADTYAAMPLLIIVPVLAGFITMYTFLKVILAMAKGQNKIAPRPAPYCKTAAYLSFIPVLFFTCGFELSSEHLFTVHFAGVSIAWPALVSVFILLASVFAAKKVKITAPEIKTDTYEITKSIIKGAAILLFAVDRFMDKLIDTWPSKAVNATARAISKFHRGNTPLYLIWAVLGIIAFIILASRGGAN